MKQLEFRRLPRHLGVMPDGNRRWAEIRGLPRDQGYAAGVEPGLHMLGVCQQLGIEELSVYGFTQENVRRPGAQVAAFQVACSKLAQRAVAAGAALLVLGDTGSPAFPVVLRPFARRRTRGRIKLNLLVNYSWRWDLSQVLARPRTRRRAQGGLPDALGSAAVSRVDLVIRWGAAVASPDSCRSNAPTPTSTCATPSGPMASKCLASPPSPGRGPRLLARLRHRSLPQ